MKEKILHIFYRLLGALARHYVKKWKPIVIGINGSVGKTSCRMIITDILEKYLPMNDIYTSPKNFNGELGMSLAIFKIESWGASLPAMIGVIFKAMGLAFFSTKKPYDVTILEYGIDTPGEMTFLLSIVKPHISVLTKIDAVHSLQFGNPEEIAKEETKLQKGTLETCIINYDDSYGRSLRDYINVDTLRYETNETTATDITIRYNNYTLVQHDNVIGSASDISIGSKNIHITTSILGKHNHGYAAVGLAIADIVHYKIHGRDCIPQSGGTHLHLHLQAGRLTVLEGIHNSIIIDSSYNGSPLSVQAAINDVYRIHREILPNYKVILVIGDMRELGEWEEKHHRELAAYLSQYADTTILLGAATGKYTMDELGKTGHDMNKVHHFTHYDKVGEKVKHIIESDLDHKYLILFKGSQNTIFLEEAVKHILKHEYDQKKLTRQGDRWMEKKNRVMKEAGLQ